MLSSQIRQFISQKNYPHLHPKAVFFDMDGILFDSMVNHSESWLRAMTESGLPFTKYDAYLNEGRTGTATINSVFVKLNGREATEPEKQAIYKLKSKYFEQLPEPKTMPYAFELLKKLKAEGYKILVVTGSAQPSLIDSLTVHFPGIFTKNDIISAFDVQNGKPHPEPYLKALARVGVEPWEALVVENAPMGVKAASAAGIFTIGVNTGPLEPELLLENGANVVFGSMRELYEIWDKLKFDKTHNKL